MRNCHTAFHSGFTFPPTVYKSSLFSTSSPPIVISLLFWIFFHLKDNCFIVLCWIYNNVNQPHAFICPLPLECPSCSPHPTLHPSRLLQSTGLLYSNFPLAISFTYGNVYVSVLLSHQFVPPSLFRVLAGTRWHIWIGIL